MTTEQLAAKMIKELQDAGYTPDQMLKVFKMAKEKHQALINNCQHKHRTQNFSDVFGYYQTCLDCGVDLEINTKMNSRFNAIYWLLLLVFNKNLNHLKIILYVCIV